MSSIYLIIYYFNKLIKYGKNIIKPMIKEMTDTSSTDPAIISLITWT